MILRCVLDGLLLPAVMRPQSRHLVAYDGMESFEMEAIEAIYYEVVCASPQEWLELEQANYRMLKAAMDFSWVEESA